MRLVLCLVLRKALKIKLWRRGTLLTVYDFYYLVWMKLTNCTGILIGMFVWQEVG